MLLPQWSTNLNLPFSTRPPTPSWPRTSSYLRNGFKLFLNSEHVNEFILPSFLNAQGMNGRGRWK